MTVMRRVSLKLAWQAPGPEGLFHVLPDLLLQHEGDQKEYEQEPDHAYAELLPLALDRLPDVVEEIDYVANDVVVIACGELALFDELELFELLHAVVLGKHGALRALQLPQHVRHCGAGKDDVVHAGGAARC